MGRVRKLILGGSKVTCDGRRTITFTSWSKDGRRRKTPRLLPQADPGRWWKTLRHFRKHLGAPRSPSVLPRAASIEALAEHALLKGLDQGFG